MQQCNKKKKSQFLWRYYITFEMAIMVKDTYTAINRAVLN